MTKTAELGSSDERTDADRSMASKSTYGVGGGSSTMRLHRPNELTADGWRGPRSDRLTPLGGGSIVVRTTR